MAEDITGDLLMADEDDDDDDGLLLVPTVERSLAKRHGRGSRTSSPQLLVGVVANSDLEDPRAGLAKWASAMEHKPIGTHLVGFLVVVWALCARDAPSTEDICFARSLGPRRYGEVLAYVDFRRLRRAACCRSWSSMATSRCVW